MTMFSALHVENDREPPVTEFFLSREAPCCGIDFGSKKSEVTVTD